MVKDKNDAVELPTHNLKSVFSFGTTHCTIGQSLDLASCVSSKKKSV